MVLNSDTNKVKNYILNVIFFDMILVGSIKAFFFKKRKQSEVGVVVACLLKGIQASKEIFLCIGNISSFIWILLFFRFS